ncbi:MAG: response regulator [Leptolyngbya sp.]|nr:response regulator [Leptolyngbya sp.]
MELLGRDHPIQIVSPPPVDPGSGALSPPPVAKILVVEDDPDNLTLARYVVEDTGHQVLLATTGAEAIAHLHQHTVTLVLMDILLPDLDGFALLSKLRQGGHNRTVPVIAVTALTQVAMRQQILAADFDGYLPKPYGIDALETLIRHYCGHLV